MEGGRLETVLIGVALVVMVAGVGLSTLYGFGTPSQVTLINRSVEAIRDARLRQGDRETTLGRIDPGQMRSADFMPKEGSLTLTVTLNSGRTLSAENVGYVTPGIALTALFNVTDDKVALLNIVKRNSGAGAYSKR